MKKLLFEYRNEVYAYSTTGDHPSYKEAFKKYIQQFKYFIILLEKTQNKELTKKERQELDIWLSNNSWVAQSSKKNFKKLIKELKFLLKFIENLNKEPDKELNLERNVSKELFQNLKIREDRNTFVYLETYLAQRIEFEFLKKIPSNWLTDSFLAGSLFNKDKSLFDHLKEIIEKPTLSNSLDFLIDKYKNKQISRKQTLKYLLLFTGTSISNSQISRALIKSESLDLLCEFRKRSSFKLISDASIKQIMTENLISHKREFIKGLIQKKLLDLCFLDIYDLLTGARAENKTINEDLKESFSETYLKVILNTKELPKSLDFNKNRKFFEKNQDLAQEIFVQAIDYFLYLFSIDKPKERLLLLIQLLSFENIRKSIDKEKIKERILETSKDLELTSKFFKEDFVEEYQKRLLFLCSKFSNVKKAFLELNKDNKLDSKLLKNIAQKLLKQKKKKL